MMRVLLCSSYKGVVGGITKWTEHILKYIPLYACDRVDLDICSTGRSVLVCSVSKIARFYYALKDYYKILKHYKKKIRSCQIDVVHICSSGSWGLLRDIYMLKCAKDKGIKTVVHFHFGRIPELFNLKNKEWKLLIQVLALTDLVIVMDRQSYEVLKYNNYLNVEYIPNPLAPEILEIVKKENVVRKKNMLLYAGHVVVNKGVVDLVKACKNISDINLILVGKVILDMKNYLYQIAATNENGWLTILGEQSFNDVVKLMCECNVFVLPSYSEGFPNVILESMACGCPIVATSVGAISEMLTDKNGMKCGISIEPRNVEALRDSILYLLENPEEAEEYGMRARRKVIETYSMKKVCSMLVDSWQKLIDKN